MSGLQLRPFFQDFIILLSSQHNKPINHTYFVDVFITCHHKNITC
jgi:hypothetical protein